MKKPVLLPGAVALAAQEAKEKKFDAALLAEAIRHRGQKFWIPQNAMMVSFRREGGALSGGIDSAGSVLLRSHREDGHTMIAIRRDELPHLEKLVRMAMGKKPAKRAGRRAH